jgi:hypothetical protein
VSSRRAWQATIGSGAAVLIAACVATGTIPAAATSPPVRPHEHFIGLINGRTGHPHRVVIQMACFGAVRPGETGHPMGHQTVAVAKVGRHHSHAGYTGTGTFIGAFFGAPPPASSAPSTAAYVAFYRYRTKKLPTSLVLPCSGNGTVTFVALPMNFHSRSYGVPVTFEGQP